MAVTAAAMPLLARIDVTLHYELAGRGPPVLFIQGAGVAGDGWRPQTDALAADFQTLRYDNRGLGRSQPSTGTISIEAMAEDARMLMDAVGWPTAHVAGHSMGGLIAQQLALDHPARVRSLALLCTFARGPQGSRMTPGIVWQGLRTRIGPRPMRRRALLGMIYPAEYLRGKDTDALAEHAGRLFGRDLADSPPILMQQLRAMSRHDVFARLGELSKIPALVVSAQHDPIALPRFGRQLAQQLGATFEEIPAASHAVVLQEPGVINDRLKRFWQQVEQRAAG